jgi:hypothetical protein
LLGGLDTPDVLKIGGSTPGACLLTNDRKPVPAPITFIVTNALMTHNTNGAIHHQSLAEGISAVKGAAQMPPKVAVWLPNQFKWALGVSLPYGLRIDLGLI